MRNHFFHFLLTARCRACILSLSLSVFEMSNKAIFTPLASSSPKKEEEIPSLSNPPKAPKKRPTPIWRTQVLDRIPPFPKMEDLERTMYGTWNVRPKYLHYVPADVEMINCPVLLRDLHQRYSMPASQPRNVDETLYLDIMSEALLQRMATLKLLL